jgi:N-acetylmuramoyl-L-alanine amidase
MDLVCGRDILQTAPHFNSEQALRIIGYDTQNLPAAIKAFKLHFIEVDSVFKSKYNNTIYSIYKTVNQSYKI